MATVVLTMRGDAIAPRPVRLRDRLAARIKARRLDSDLAAGAAPDADVAHALRAATLIAPAERSMLARSLQRVVRDARDPRTALSLRAPVTRRTALTAAAELDALASRLLSSEPVSARGVAQVGRLLGDAGSPLYGGPEDDLRGAARRALVELEPS
jgi:hypothetical protein